MCEKNVIHGPEPLVPICKDSLGIQLYQSLLQNQHLPFAQTDAVTGESISFKAMLERSCRIAKSLQKHGLIQNSVIAICSENNLDFICPIVAAMYLGVVVTTFNPSYSKGEILHCANISKPSIIFCSRYTSTTISKIKNQIPFAQKIVVIDAKQTFNEYESMEEFILNGSDKQFNPTDFKPTTVDVTKQAAFILYSSGTTGLPKGVTLTHWNFNVTLAAIRDPRIFKQYGDKAGAHLGLLPFYHAYGLCVCFISLIIGRRVVVLKRFEETTFLKTLQDYKITDVNLVPPLITFLAKSPMVNNYDLSSIEEIYCGAAPLSKEIEEAVKKRLNVDSILQGYGMTETTLGVLLMPVGHTKHGSCGKVAPYTSAKVVDPDTRQALGPRQPGELCFKGGMIMKGYAGDNNATRNIIDDDGWLSTGDIGYYDEDGYFYIVDRLKELIKYKSFQVPPAELEAILLTNPKIKEAGVIGIPDEIAGELPLAFVVKQSNQQLTEEEVKKFVADQVSPQKWLRGGVRFLDEIPKNPSGKILRRKLRELTHLPKSKL